MVTYSPDSLGRPTAASPYLSEVAYFDSGNLKRVRFGNNLLQNYEEYPTSQLPKQIAVAGQFSLTYGYGPVGTNIESVTGSNGTVPVNRTLGYDGVDRLITVNGPWGTGSIEYDGGGVGRGNISQQRFGSDITTYTYNSTSNRLESVSGLNAMSFGYNTRGEVTGNGSFVFGYDEAGNMVCDAPAQQPAVACASASSKAEYGYDGKGWRVWELRGGAKTYFHHALNGDLLYEHSPSSGEWKKHVYLNGKRVATKSSPRPTTTVLEVLVDGGGSPTSLRATVSPSPESGSVNFVRTPGGTTPVFLTNGVATLQLSSFGCGGVINVSAQYPGDAAYAASNSSSQQVTLPKCVPSVSMTATPAASAARGQLVVLSAVLTGTSGPPTGAIAFTRSGTSIGAPVTLINGSASLETASLPVGSWTLAADYSGDSAYLAGSTSVSLTIRIDEAPARGNRFELNADGRDDLLWFQPGTGAMRVWTMSGVTPLATGEILGPGQPWMPRVIGDFDGNGFGDLLVQKSDGTTALMFLNGTSVVSAPWITGPMPWTAVATGDLDGDGRSDIVWRKNDDGMVALWTMNGSAYKQALEVLGPNTGWSVRFVRDFDGDGRGDLLWSHDDGSIAIWLMNGLQQVGGATLLGPGTGWVAQRGADFDGDGKSDLLFRHADGSYVVWLMTGVNMTASATLRGPGTGWEAVLAGDFNGDGKADILWRHTDGSYVIWFMDGVTMLPSSGALPVTGADWLATHAKDLNGDGKSDIVFRNTVDGRISVWLMNGLTVIQATEIYAGGDGWVHPFEGR